MNCGMTGQTPFVQGMWQRRVKVKEMKGKGGEGAKRAEGDGVKSEGSLSAFFLFLISFKMDYSRPFPLFCYYARRLGFTWCDRSRFPLCALLL